MRIGMLTSGGDCQGLNAALRGVAKALYERFGSDVEIYGIQDGYRGLIEGSMRLMQPQEFSGILTLGGTILGTSRQPFKLMQKILDENSTDRVSQMVANYKKWNLDALVILGGNGTHKTANLLSEKGLNVITLPKTIDNDLWGTDITFGFQSAVNVASQVIDAIHTTATSHGRCFIIEIMGNKVGWLTLYAGISAGADVVLIPEIPYDAAAVAKTLDKRADAGKNFSIIAVAEGAVSKQDSKLSKKELAQKREKGRFPSVSYALAQEVQSRTGQEIRVTVPGHFQRGGSPCPADRLLATRLGVTAADLIAKKNFGNMVGMVNNETTPVPLSKVAGKLKTVPADLPLIRHARELGITFGE